VAGDDRRMMDDFLGHPQKREVEKWRERISK